jgi:hypothetical protein
MNMAKNERVWFDPKVPDWNLWRQPERGKTSRVVFTLKSPGGKKGGWRVYSSRTSPHRVEIRFEKAK